jgi:hypothetical protein
MDAPGRGHGTGMPNDDVVVTVCPGGPLLVRGPATVVGPDGAPVARTRRTVALCRCGLSGIKPWCDGSHKLAPAVRTA